ncbi:hypothetical protein [Nocardia niwae]|uniref:hypothetical protein n=1 Tax=Nocardia niwae TaxID=626084 RepID=UPI0033CF3AD7
MRGVCWVRLTTYHETLPPLMDLPPESSVVQLPISADEAIRDRLRRLRWAKSDFERPSSNTFVVRRWAKTDPFGRYERIRTTREFFDYDPSLEFEDGLELLREQLDAMAEQIPAVTHGPDRYYGEPPYPLWWTLNRYVERFESGDWPGAKALFEARKYLADRDERDVVWVKCARRNMFVAAVIGQVWDYGHPRPELPAQ